MWYYDGIEYSVKNGLIVGVGDYRFNPNGTTSHAAAATMLQRFCENVAK